jgi:hypothetical protein
VGDGHGGVGLGERVKRAGGESRRSGDLRRWRRIVAATCRAGPYFTLNRLEGGSDRRVRHSHALRDAVRRTWRERPFRISVSLACRTRAPDEIATGYAMILTPNSRSGAAASQRSQ